MSGRNDCHGINTSGAVLTWTTGALVHIYIAVTPERAGVGAGAFQDRTFHCVLADELVCTHAVREPLSARACVGVIGNRAVAGGIAASGPILAWITVAFVDVYIAVGAGACVC